MNPESDEPGLRLLQLAARMLLEYNWRSAVLVTRIERLAAYLKLPARALVGYRCVVISLADGRAFHLQTPEYRLNVAVSSEVLRVIDRVCSGGITPTDALAQMQALEPAQSPHRLWVLAVLFGSAASALAWILGADYGTIAISALSSVLGLLARRVLGRRHWPLFSLPFVAAAIGGVIGGLAIRFGWTQTSELCLMVPALMLVPGPHLINGFYDIFENHVQTGICRLVLSLGILISAAIGILAGVGLTGGLQNATAGGLDAMRLTLLLDMALAGIAASGFAAFYNSPWRVLGISVAVGMIGHGVRFVSLDLSLGLAGSTLLACIAIGILAGAAASRWRLPFSSVAFAGAVPMMPGSLIYRSIAGAARLSWAGTSADPALATATLALLLRALLVIGGMATGLLIGAFAASFAGKCILFLISPPGRTEPAAR